MTSAEKKARQPTYAETVMGRVPALPHLPLNMLVGLLGERGLVRITPGTLDQPLKDGKSEFVSIASVTRKGVAEFDRVFNDPRFRTIHFAVLGQSQIQFDYALTASGWRSDPVRTGRLEAVFLANNHSRLRRDPNTIQKNILATSQLNLKPETVRELTEKELKEIENRAEVRARQTAPYSDEEIRQLIAEIVDEPKRKSRK